MAQFRYLPQKTTKKTTTTTIQNIPQPIEY